MTPGILAMLLGAFALPAALVWMGHRLRRRSPAWRSAFWGALIGHLLAIPIAVIAAMVPAAEWAPTDTLRGALGFWLLLVAPLAGALVGGVLGGRSRRDY